MLYGNCMDHDGGRRRQLGVPHDERLQPLLTTLQGLGENYNDCGDRGKK